MKPSYSRLLAYHGIVYIFPFLLIGLIFFQQIYNAVHGIFALISWLNTDEPSHVLFIVSVVAKALMRLIMTAAVVALIGQLFSNALHFIPYLAINRKLSAMKLLGLGFRKYIYIFIFNILGYVVIFCIHAIIVIIPVVNMLSIVTFPFCVAVFTLYKDYLFSINMNNQNFIWANPLQHLNLYLKKTNLLWVAGLLAASYYVFYVASVFIRPYAQLKLIQQMEEVIATDHAFQATRPYDM